MEVLCVCVCFGRNLTWTVQTVREKREVKISPYFDVGLYTLDQMLRELGEICSANFSVE